MNDQRNAPRVPVRRRIWCEADDRTLYVQALNVSARGLFVRTASPPLPGAKVRVSLPDLPGGEVVAQAEVMWTRSGRGEIAPGMGLRIVAFEKGLESFEDFVATTRA